VDERKWIGDYLTCGINLQSADLEHADLIHDKENELNPQHQPAH